MSLQVWLPLTKDLRQQGLSNIKVENHNATLNTAGKLGSCYYFNGSQQWLQFDTVLGDYYNNDWSIACWLKPTDSTRSVIISEYSSTGASNVGLELTTSRVVRLYWNGSPDINFTTAGALPINEWTHLTVTKQARVVKVYFNGELKQTYTNSSDFSTRTSASYPRIGDDYRGNSANTVSYQGYINDFRMYDHCLSPMEVKELAKGLILHYPLNRQGWGQENLLPISGSTIIDSTQSFEFQGWVQNFYTKTWMNEHLTPGKQYTLSYTVTCLSIPDSTYTFKENRASPILVHQGSGWSQTTTTSDGIKDTNMSVGQSRDYKCTFTFATATENYEYYGLCGYTALYRNSSNNTQYAKFKIDNLKLEEGSIATPWCPNSSDVLATTMGLNSTTEYDCSGFCNNGEKIGALTYTSDTSKYQVSTHIGATSQKIHISGLTTSGFGNSYSFAWWGKRTSNNPMFWGFSDGIRLNGMYIGTLWNTGDGSNNPLYKIGTTTQVTAPSVNVWHHYVMTGNGTKCYVYLDGELWAEAKTYKAISGTSIYINGWNSATDYCSDNTDISDFRIYATALSASDIKSLYQNSAYIDSSGNVYGAVHTEV